MRALAGTLLFVLATSGHARVVGTDATIGAPPEVCRILGYDPGERLSFVCSGVMASRNQLLTAAHCLKDGKVEHRVQCGFRSVNRDRSVIEHTKKGAPVHTADVSFAENHVAQAAFSSPWYIEEHDDGSHDIARMELPTRESGPYLPLGPVDLERCWTVGFGFAQDGTAGIPHLAPLRGPIRRVGSKLVHSVRVRVDRDKPRKQIWAAIGNTELSVANRFQRVLRILAANSLLTGMPMPGDSGGPLLCVPRGQKTGWAIAGVASVIEIKAEQTWMFSPMWVYVEFTWTRVEGAEVSRKVF